MLKFLPLLMVLAVSLAKEDNDLEEIIKQLQQRAASTTSTTTTTTTSTTKPTEAVETCVTDNDERGECVPYYQCSNGSVSTDGGGLLDFRAPVCSSSLDVCCLTPASAPVPPASTPLPPASTPLPPASTPLPPASTPLPPASTPLPPVSTPLPPASTPLPPVSTPLPPVSAPIPPAMPPLPPACLGPVEPVTPIESCGWRNYDRRMSGVDSRVLGSTGETAFGEFPWMVAIFKAVVHSELNGLPQGMYFGGGSLIHPSIVLTAAHILRNTSASELQVRAGEWDMRTRDEPQPHQDRDVAEVVVHQDFMRRNLFNDIALLFLKVPVSDAPHVGVACLPRAGVPAPAGTCLASGWGKDKFGPEGTYQTVLKSVEVPVVDRQRCTELLRSTRLGRYFMLHHSFMCAGERDRDTCTGDGGSPLVCPSLDARRWVQHGVVSWGVRCGGAPGVYAAVGAARAWVDREVVARGFDPRVYTLEL